MEIRLQKMIADCGITSRRKAEVLITEGKVTVNGKKVTELGTKVDPEIDMVTVNGELIDLDKIDPLYIILNKPRSCMTTLNDPEGRKTVLDCLKGIKARVFPVGRLDYLSEGLLIMTNDGDLAQKIAHPKYEVTKVYEVKIFGRINEYILNELKKGIVDYDGVLKPKSVRVIKQLQNKTWLEFRLNEGKNREIRRLCEAVGLTIDKLKRVAIEGLSITGIKPGEFVMYSKTDLLKKLGMKADGTKVKKEYARHIYKSPKKSVPVAKVRVPKDRTKANDPTFQKFRKDTYNEVVKTLKEKREKAKSEGDGLKFNNK